jgi:O-acetylhomoserine/O-acetylserine sulfhydrylase-like pyridoxal-dependent enzyme
LILIFQGAPGHLEAAWFFYTRLPNPATDGFETWITQMEGAVGAMATLTGQAATTLAIMNICRSGQHDSSSVVGRTTEIQCSKAGPDPAFHRH